MAKMVGLSRNLKLPWLNEVVRLYAEGLDDNQIKEKLNEYLSFEIGSPTVLRKTREILMNIWVYENDYTAALRDEALRLFQKDSDYEFNVNIGNQRVNLRDKGLGVEFHQEFYDDSDPSKALGRINYKYDTDLSLNIEFYGGDVFRYEDVADSKQSLKISEVYNECCLYYDAIVDLFEEVYSEIYPEMQLLPTFLGSGGKPNIKHNPTSISINEYFKEA